MKSTEHQLSDTRPAGDPRPAEFKRSEVERKEGASTRFVDPFEMRAEPQPEEPGYGHGV